MPVLTPRPCGQKGLCSASPAGMNSASWPRSAPSGRNTRPCFVRWPRAEKSKRCTGLWRANGALTGTPTARRRRRARRRSASLSTLSAATNLPTDGRVGSRNSPCFCSVSRFTVATTKCVDACGSRMYSMFSKSMPSLPSRPAAVSRQSPRAALDRTSGMLRSPGSPAKSALTTRPIAVPIRTSRRSKPRVRTRRLDSPVQSISVPKGRSWEPGMLVDGFLWIAPSCDSAAS
mmetsp:Transcript_13051/g.41165  ORF Transcript_13051/g.41165 Transcript_13051/m.41165 type:complete len:232 (-) Transcript_13051:394-1089(-)